MLERTIEYRKIRIKVREKITKDLFDVVAVAQKLEPEPPETNFRREYFAMAVMQTVEVENLPFEWVTLSSSVEKTRAAYKAWCDMKPALGKAWSDAIYNLNNTVDDEELAPILAMGE